MKIVEQTLEETNAYSLFVYAIRSQVIRDYYLRRLRIFLIILIYNLILQWKKDVIILQLSCILVLHYIFEFLRWEYE